MSNGGEKGARCTNGDSHEKRINVNSELSGNTDRNRSHHNGGCHVVHYIRQGHGDDQNQCQDEGGRQACTQTQNGFGDQLRPSSGFQTSSDWNHRPQQNDGWPVNLLVNIADRYDLKKHHRNSGHGKGYLKRGQSHRSGNDGRRKNTHRKPCLFPGSQIKPAFGQRKTAQ